MLLSPTLYPTSRSIPYFQRSKSPLSLKGLWRIEEGYKDRRKERGLQEDLEGP